jgi:hypothetical protein
LVARDYIVAFGQKFFDRKAMRGHCSVMEPDEPFALERINDPLHLAFGKPGFEFTPLGLGLAFALVPL